MQGFPRIIDFSEFPVDFGFNDDVIAFVLEIIQQCDSGIHEPFLAHADLFRLVALTVFISVKAFGKTEHIHNA